MYILKSWLLTVAVFGYTALILLYYYYAYAWDYLSNVIGTGNPALAAYDFIIIGGGTAGCILASRLSEIPDFQVLLVESGGHFPHVLSDVPAFAAYLQRTHYDWNYRTTAQKKACHGHVNSQSLWPRGKGLGGTSNLHYMFYAKGHPRDFENWHPDWTFGKLEQYFRKSTEELPIQPIRFSPLSEEWIEAANILGHPVIDDYNGPQQIGFSKIQVNQVNGKRCSTFQCYLQPHLHRPNLHVLTQAHATKLNFSGKRCTGVTVTRFGEELSFKATKEVIASSGTIGTTQLLLLSGIGPSEHLRALDIPVISDLPVGENLQDHVSTYLGPFLLNDTVSVNPVRDFSLSSVWNYFWEGGGMMTTSAGAGGIAFANSKDASDNWPDVQLLIMSLGMVEQFHDVAVDTLGITEKVWEEFFMPLMGFDTTSFLPIVARPKSRGTIRLQSSKYADPPIIDPNYFSHEEDIRVLLHAIHLAINITRTAPFQKYDAQLSDIHLPGCENHVLHSDAYWRCYIRHVTTTVYHPVGTCKLGYVHDETAVVDERLRVKGLHGLRVVDASVMPNIVNTHPHAAIAAITEKAADLIKLQWMKREAHAEQVRVVDEL